MPGSRDPVRVRHSPKARSARVARPITLTDNGQLANQPFLVARFAPPKSAVVGSNAVESGPFENRELGEPFDSISGAGSPRSAALAARCLRVFRSLREARGTPYSFKALAPPMISISSVVIAAWRARLYCSVSRSIISDAFLVAESMAVMRAPSSEAIDS